MIRTREKELGYSESPSCENCEYLYSPLRNFCGVCRESTLTTIICSCGAANSFTGETKNRRCALCQREFPDVAKLSEHEDARIKFHLEGDTLHHDEAIAV